MEVEVRVVGGIEGCFVSLPLLLLQTLQSTRADPLPPVLALELRSRTHDGKDRLWHVAWSGSASSSSAIEIAQQYAECISLSDLTTVQVRATRNVPKATRVTIEPHTEDDWEVLELNAEHAEAAILKQVGIVHEAMKFPLWLHGRSIVTFVVVSIFPMKPVVQLVPGTEVSVAPKSRKRNINSYEESSLQSSDTESFIPKVLLRVQAPDSRFTHKTEVKGVEMSVSLTSAVFIHPETAKNYSFSLLQFVILLPRLSSMENKGNYDTDSARMKSSAGAKQVNGGVFTEKRDYRLALVRLLMSESVAKGHVMLSESLRIYLRAGLHSWIYLKRADVNVKKGFPTFLLSPCQFNMLGNDEGLEKNGSDGLDNHKNHKTKNMFLKTDSDSYEGPVDWSTHDCVLAALSHVPPANEDEEAVFKPNIQKGILNLFRAWCLAQLHSIVSNAGVEVNSLILGNAAILHFEVKGHKFAQRGTGLASYTNSWNIRQRRGESSADMFYVLSTSEGSMLGGKIDAYEIAFDEQQKISGSGSLESLLEKLHLGDGVHLYSVKDRTFDKCFNTTISSLSWMGTATSDVINRLTVLLSPASGKLLSTYNLPSPGHILVHGPAGSGKTLLATTIAKYFEEHEDILAHVVFICCSRLALEKTPTIRQALSGYISEALDHAPSLVVFDDLDSIISSSSNLDGSQPSSSVLALTEFLTEVVDEYEEKRRFSCGIGPIALIASAQSLTNIPPSLSSSGRFDFHVQLPPPAAAERGALLKHEIHKRALQCSDDILLDIASTCDGYDAYDLEILVDRSVHTAISRFLSSDNGCGGHGKPTLVRDDFMQAMHGFLPVSMRDITKSAPEGGRSGWEDVGGLVDIRNAIKEMIELPSKFPNIFAKAPLRLRSNVLLYGPPGCGKTHIVGAAAAACSLRFISVKGPELLNKYIGASEQAVRDIFSKAAAAAPCLLFFDEFDSIAPKRGHDNTGVTDRVVNQFLTELDGVEVLTGVFVFAATSRPDLLDAALLRPGRLDRLLFCDFPSPRERLDILTVLSRKLPIDSDVDWDAIAYMTEGFSGADLQALLSDAQLAAVHNFLGDDGAKLGKVPVISNDLLKSIAAKARPSVSEAEKQRLYDIYSQFLDSKKSVAAQSRDAKGKRATLA